MKIKKGMIHFSILLFALLMVHEEVLAHGEKAQQAGLRMRTLNWFDTEIYPRNIKVNDTVTVKGKFIPNKKHQGLQPI